ncbi:MAG: autotransporter outer membrane beta-barrel domain-containing protein, partial [Methylobacillus sp.]|nr:autotransporter outer membrane beta-barrel domain-containing protein [Methylobacillus sp.]
MVAMVAGLLASSAHAACDLTSGSSYTCSGTNTTPQSINADDAAVITSPGFSVDTSPTGDDALFIRGYGSLSYTDTNAASFTSGGLWLQSDGDNGATSGAVTIQTNGDINSDRNGITTLTTFGSTGATTVITTGQVIAGNEGIHINHLGSGDLTVNAASVTAVRDGINAWNQGVGGATNITATGLVTGDIGISATNDSRATNITVNASDVVGNSNQGIIVRNRGSGATNITATGLVTGGSNGIDVENQPMATDLIVVANNVTGNTGTGIRAYNMGYGATTITATGLVTGRFEGITVNTYLSGTELTINAVDVTGSYIGILATHFGSGAASITTTGQVMGTNGYGISARNYGTELTLNVVNVTGELNGIYAQNQGTGTTNITTHGIVEGGVSAIYADSVEKITLVNTASGLIRNLSQASTDLAIETATGAVDLSNAGTITGIVRFSAPVSGVNAMSNTGIWNTAGGTNAFGNGTLINSGTINAAAVGAPTAVTTVFGGLNSFTLASQGTLNLGNGIVGDVARIDGNYIGQGGTITLDTTLDTDGSPSDRLVINGNATGTTRIIITNVGGTGDETTGNGIEVVQINGTSTSTAFALGNPGGYAVGGAYAYTLRYQDASGLGQNWYLVSSQLCIVDPNNPVCASPTGGGVPDIRPEVSLYTAIPNLALTYGSALLNTLHERTPTRPYQYAPKETGCDVKNDDWAECDQPAVWMRALGGGGTRDGGSPGIYGSRGPSYDYDYAIAQLGVDVMRSQTTEGTRNHLGVYYAYGQIEGDVGDVNRGRAGDARLIGNSLGLYYTRFASAGAYVDAVAQGTWYDIAADRRESGLSLDTHGFGFAASLEGGYPFWSDEDQRWGLEPQAQLTYQTITIARKGEQGSATRVGFNDVESLQGRLGLRLVRNWKDSAQAIASSGSGWLRASLINEFIAQPETRFSSASGTTPFESKLTGAGFELRAGFDGWYSGIALS